MYIVFSNGSISKLNANSPSVEKEVKVANYFDVSVDWLLGVNLRTFHPQATIELRKHFEYGSYVECCFDAY